MTIWCSGFLVPVGLFLQDDTHRRKGGGGKDDIWSACVQGTVVLCRGGHTRLAFAKKQRKKMARAHRNSGTIGILGPYIRTSERRVATVGDVMVPE